ncbi:MAG TPA: hypothetical protein VGD08_24330 [Stellaceae bacterium]
MAGKRKDTDRLDRPQGGKPSLGGIGRETERPDVDEKRQESVGGTPKEGRESVESGMEGEGEAASDDRPGGMRGEGG